MKVMPVRLPQPPHALQGSARDQADGLVTLAGKLLGAVRKVEPETSQFNTYGTPE